MTNDSLVLNGKTYSSRVCWRSKRTVCFERNHTFSEFHREIDAAPFWGVALVESFRQPLQFKVNGSWFTPPLGSGLLIPPFQFFQWQVEPSEIRWRGYFVLPTLSLASPSKQASIISAQAPSPSNEEELLEFLNAQTAIAPLDQFNHRDPVAFKAKHLIDESFMEPVPINTFAQRLGLGSSQFTRTFKRAFGLNPHLYRQKLRLYYSQVMMLVKGQNVTETCFELGYNDLSRFSRSFQKAFQIQPSAFAHPNRQQGR